MNKKGFAVIVGFGLLIVVAWFLFDFFILDKPTSIWAVEKITNHTINFSYHEILNHTNLTK